MRQEGGDDQLRRQAGEPDERTCWYEQFSPHVVVVIEEELSTIVENELRERSKINQLELRSRDREKKEREGGEREVELTVVPSTRKTFLSSSSSRLLSSHFSTPTRPGNVTEGRGSQL